MRYESAVSLKASLMSQGVGTHAAVARSLPGAAMAFAAAAPSAPRTARPFALGITGRGKDYRLAVRVQDLTPGVEEAVESVRQKARGECDVRLVGKVIKQQWHRRKNRPLRIGGSVGHVKVTAGTLGCFVRKTTVEQYLVLSNNHVLADENNASVGDTILQQARLDGGRVSTANIGELEKFIRLKNRNNLVDAATASMNDGLEFFYNWLEDLGPISGIRQGPLDEGELVYKVGRTTGLTRGRISSIELDGVRVKYDRGILEFDNQLEIAPADGQPFSLGGDSGSLIVDRRRRAVGLLFAGNDVDATFANPIESVLSTLNVALVY